MTKENKDIIPIEEQPYAVPANWQWVRLGAINIYKSKNITFNKEGNRTYELYSVPSYAEAYPEIISESEIGSSKQLVQKNDVLLCKINPRINRVWKVFSYTAHQTLASSEWIVVRNNVLYMAYLMWSFRCPYFRTYMLSNVSGVGGSLMRARPQFVKEYPVPIPPLQEQKRIVECITEQFSKLDKAKERIQSVLDSSETRKAAILHKAFTGELTASWRKENKQEMFRDNVLFDSCIEKMQNGLSKRKGDEGEDRIVLRLINIQDTGIDLSDIRKIKLNKNEQEKYSLQKKDSIMIRVNGSKNNVGKQVLLTETINNLSFCDHLIRIQYKNNVLPKYMIYFSKTETYKRYVEKNMVSSAGQNTISRKGLKNLYVPVFTLEEQREIVRILDDLLAKEQRIVDIAAATLQRIDTMKQAILAKAFRGELGTNDPSEPPAPLTAKGDLSC